MRSTDDETDDDGDNGDDIARISDKVVKPS